MRIVIETDQPDDNEGTTRTAQRQREAMVLDGGPAPAALLRRFGRIPETQAETETEEEGERFDESKLRRESETGESEGGEMELNPLRHGAAVARRRHESEGCAPAGDETGDGSDHVPAEDPDLQ